MYHFRESDWKTFRAMLVELRENYLARVNRELIALLSNPSASPTQQFWDAEERIRTEAGILRECLDNCKRSTMSLIVGMMRRYGMLDDTHFARFSPELQEHITSIMKY